MPEIEQLTTDFRLISAAQRELPRCASIGCISKATELISYIYRGDGDREYDRVCTPCAASYERRQVLTQFTRDELADAFAGLPVPDDSRF